MSASRCLRWIQVIALQVLVVSMFSCVSFAEDSDRGRLPDGRAYRMDGQGNQLVDYIAELELEVDALNRRVRGLEGQVAEKDREISRISRTSGSKPRAETSTAGLVERDLSAAGAESAGWQVGPTTREHELARIRCEDQSERALQQEREICSRQIKEMQDEFGTEFEAMRKKLGTERMRTTDVSQQALQTCRGELQRLSRQISDERRQIVKLKQAVGESGELQAELRTKEQDLKSKQDSLQATEVALQSSSSEVEVLESKLNAVQTELRGARDEIVMLHAKLSAADNAADLARDAARRAHSEAIEQGTRNAVVSTSPLLAATETTRKAAVTADTSSKEEPRAALSSLSPRERALSVLRASVLDELIAFEGLVARRDAAFERYHSRAKPLGKGSAVKISPSKIVTSRGFTPDKIRLRIKLAKRASDLSYMRKQIAELRKKVKGDLVIVKRMSTS